MSAHAAPPAVAGRNAPPPVGREACVAWVGSLVSCSAALAPWRGCGFLPRRRCPRMRARCIAHAVLAARAAPQPLAFAYGPDPEEAVGGFLDSVQARFGDAALDFGPVLRRWWMGRMIAFEAVPLPLEIVSLHHHADGGGA